MLPLSVLVSPPELSDLPPIKRISVPVQRVNEGAAAAASCSQLLKLSAVAMASVSRPRGPCLSV